MHNTERQIKVWRDHLRAKGNLTEADIDELESHLRDEIDSLESSGLSEEEAFLISIKRLGNAHALSREYAKLYIDGFWKQLMLDQQDPAERTSSRHEIILLILLSLIAGTMAKIPELFGSHLYAEENLFYLKNMSLFFVPLIAIFFAWKRRLSLIRILLILAPSILTFVLINLYPFQAPFHTEKLIGIHLPVLLWLTVCIAYAPERWMDASGRMDFLRFTGETFVYTVLIICGGGVLVFFTQAIFSAIGVDTSKFVSEYLIVYGGLAAPIVAAYLVEAKKSIVENLAPILAKIFSPLFLITMIAYLLAMVVLKKSPFMEREYLIGFDIMLALVLGMVLYVISARKNAEIPDFYDYVNFALILAALIIDCIALSAIIFRLSAFGFSANKTAALGENLLMLANLIGLAWLYFRFFSKKIEFLRLEQWQMRYLPLYAGWLAFVVFVFPWIFSFQ